MWMLVSLTVYGTLVLLISRTLDFNQITGGIIIQLLALMPLIWFLFSHFSGKLKLAYFFNRKPGKRGWMIVVIFWILVFILTTAIEGLQLTAIERLSPGAASDWMEGPVFYPDQKFIINLLNLSLIILVAPVMEEMVFRGLILQRLMVRTSVTKALFFTSVVFGLLHFEFGLSAGIFGLFMGLVFLQTKNLLVPILLHIGNNALVVCINIWQYKNGLCSIDQLTSRWPIYLLSLLIIPLFIKFVKRYWPQPDMELPYAYNRTGP